MSILLNGVYLCLEDQVVFYFFTGHSKKLKWLDAII